MFISTFRAPGVTIGILGVIFSSFLLATGCTERNGDPRQVESPAVIALQSISDLADTTKAARRLEFMEDSLSKRRQPLYIRLALARARADVMRKRGMSDSGFACLLLGMEASMLEGDSLQLGRMLLDMCRWKDQEGRHLTAASFSKRSLELFRRHGTEQDIAEALNATARQLQNTGDYQGSQSMILEALQYFQKAGDHKMSGEAYNVIGNNYADLGETDKAMRSYRQSAVFFRETGDSIRLSASYSNIGLLYRRSNPDSALYYYNLSMNLTRDSNQRLQYVISLFNQANVYFDRKEYDRARKIYDTVMVICERDHFTDGIPRVLSGYAAIAAAYKKHRTSADYLALARRMADSNGHTILALWLRKQELEEAQQLRDIDSVISMAKDIRRREDSFAGTEKKTIIAELELRYQVAGKEREISSLHAKLAGRQWMILLLGCLVIALAGLITLYRRQRRMLIQRNRSYEVMIARYQADRDQGIIPVQTSKPLPTESGSEDIVASTLAGTDAEEVIEADKEVEASETRADYEWVLTLLKEEKLYIRARLKAEDVAERAGISARRLTVVLRREGEDGFNALLNRLRIAEASRMMEDPGFHHLKLDSLAERCGFNSRQHFYRVFEQVTGVNPGFYRKQFNLRGKQGGNAAQQDADAPSAG